MIENFFQENGNDKPKFQNSPFERLTGDEILPTLDVRKLDNGSIARHSRQLILPELGVSGE
jgi:hypothetical protein